MDLRPEVESAAGRLAGRVRETPLEESLHLSRAGSASVFLKLENLQLTGSFKLRGAFNKILWLAPEQRARGVVAASSGNHGAAVAYAARATGCRARIFVPETASPAKLKAIEGYGAELRACPGDPVEAELAARRHARDSGQVYISPYNDLQVIAGQGTIGLELRRQRPDLEVLFASLGGGGLIGGCAAFLKTFSPELEIVACSPENSPVMCKSLEAGRILDLPSKPTLSDGTAGGVEPGALTFDLCRRVIDRHLLVSEAEIRGALKDFLADHHLLIEGAAAVAVAGYLQARDDYRGRRVAIVICGANIALETLREALGWSVSAAGRDPAARAGPTDPI